MSLLSGSGVTRLLCALAVAGCATVAQADPDSVTVPPDTAAGADSITQAPDTVAIAPVAPPTAAPEIRRTRSGFPPRQFLRDLGGTAVGLVHDLGYVLSSPARMDGRDALWTAAVLGGTAVLYANDEQILTNFRRNRGNEIYDTVLWPGRHWEPIGFMGRTNPVYFSTLVIGYALDVRLLREVPAEILESHAIAGGIRNGFKFIVGRRHPFENGGTESKDSFDPGHGTSFPSGHSSVDFELATILAHHTPWKPLRVVWYAAATSLVLQRLDANAHWPSDVMISAVSGALIANTVIKRHEERKREGRPQLGFVPAPGGAAIRWSF
jgi:hypothetical protein